MFHVPFTIPCIYPPPRIPVENEGLCRDSLLNYCNHPGSGWHAGWGVDPSSFRSYLGQFVEQNLSPRVKSVNTSPRKLLVLSGTPEFVEKTGLQALRVMEEKRCLVQMEGEGDPCIWSN